MSYLRLDISFILSLKLPFTTEIVITGVKEIITKDKIIKITNNFFPFILDHYFLSNLGIEDDRDTKSSTRQINRVRIGICSGYK